MPLEPGHTHAPLQRVIALAVVLLAAAVASAESPAELMARGDAAWARRAEGSRAHRADPGPITEAVAAYELALEGSPGSIAARERLLCALYFQARFATAEDAARRDLYDRGRRLAEQGIARLAAEPDVAGPLDLRSPEETAAKLTDRPESAAMFFWAAGHWGLWAETSGALAAARRGVAGRIRDYATTAVLIDERYETAGGHRILGRLHTEAPRIPLITGWVDRDLAVSHLERAMQLSPDEPLNRLYLADALLRFRPSRKREALAMLEAMVAERPRAGSEVQDRRTLADARKLLERHAPVR